MGEKVPGTPSWSREWHLKGDRATAGLGEGTEVNGMGDEEKAALASHNHTPTPTQSGHTSTWKPAPRQLWSTKAGLGEGGGKGGGARFCLCKFFPWRALPSG